MQSKSTQRIVIYGTRGVARELHQIIDDIAAKGCTLSCLGFLVDHDYCDATVVHDLPVFGDADWLAGAPDVLVSVGIGRTEPRHRIVQDIETRFGPRFLTLQHPRAWVGGRVTIGIGSVLCAGSLVTTDIIIGRHVQLHIGCTIGHDTSIGDFVTVAPGANISGRVTIGVGTFVGAGAVVLPDVTVGSWVMIGAGAVVTKDVPDRATVVGVPARIVAWRTSG